MADRKKNDSNEHAVPSGRLARLASIGSLGAGVAGNMLSDGIKKWSKGERPSLDDLLLTPKNASRAADELSRLRGAAMKLGQLISLDAGDVIPPELSDILARLRSSANSMPPQQLKKVLIDNWGRDWRQKTGHFNVRPIAAASIGQVHRARTKEGEELAVKIQYPGVRESIDSDVNNVAALIRISGLLPKGVDISSLLEEAKEQLHEEADYLKEKAYIEWFNELLAGSEHFSLPQVHDELTTKNILAMSYMRGTPIDEMASADQETRNLLVGLLMKLLLDELFTYRLIQTDPNFANYFYDPDTDKIVLLDFGATREVPENLSEGYQALFRAGMKDDWQACRDIAREMGLMSADLSADLEQQVEDVFVLAMEPLKAGGPFDFGQSDLAIRLREKGMKLRQSGFHHIPPAATIFIHRKIAGIYLLATRLKAQIDVAELAQDYL